MADTDSTTGNAGQPGAGDPSSVVVRVVGQYIKDLSFENPNIRKLLGGPGEKPNLRVDISVSSSKMADKVFESVIDFKAEATSNAGIIYDLEIAYAGLFQVENMPEQGLEPFLLINCPTLLFPFLRRLVADLTREGGFPPLLLDPVDFAGLYMQRQQQKGAGAAGQQTVN